MRLAYDVIKFTILISISWLSLPARGELKEELFAPLNPGAKKMFMAGSAATIVSIVFRPSMDSWQQHFAETKPMGSSSHYGDLLGKMLPNAIYVGSMGWYSKDKAILMLKATLYSGAVANVIKVLAQEQRPGSTSKSSFPSGHTTVAFAFASVIGELHGLTWGIPAYLMASFVGVSRMNDNAHWPHDVIAGATLGIGYGLGLSHLHKKKSASVAFYPSPIPGGYSLNFKYAF